MNRVLVCLAAMSLAPTALHAETKPDSVRTALVSALHRIHLYDRGAAWHITIHAQVLEQGKPAEAGTVDIYRNPQGAMRTVFDLPTFHQTRYTDKSTLIEGDSGDPPPGLENFIHFFNAPERLAQLQGATLRAFDIKRRTIDFHCTRAENPATGAGPSYCNIVGGYALRYNTIGGSYVTLFEQMTDFEGGDAPTHATIYFQYQPIVRLTLDYASLSPADAEIHPSSSAVSNTKASEELNTLLNQKLVDPFVHPGPTQIAPPDNGAALLRLELKDGHIEHIETLASSDATTVRDISASIRSALASAPVPKGRMFINYSYALYVHRKNADAIETMPDVEPAND